MGRKALILGSDYGTYDMAVEARNLGIYLVHHKLNN